ncbi:MAG: Na+/H+ antiporter NhaA [Acidobacteriota bacterium]
MSEKSAAGLWPFIIENYILLVAGTVAALLWANVDHQSYEHFAGYLHFPVNDIGMAFFFALAAKEIVEAMLPGGALASPREAGMPLLAAVGGMAGPALLFKLQVMLTHRPEMASGWAIPCATDIAFSYMVARLIFPRNHPAIPFLLMLAIADDAFGLILLALFYPAAPLSFVALSGFMAPALGLAFWLKRRRVRNFWAYVWLAGSLSWAALFFGGFHPALALVPILPFMPHPQRDIGQFHAEQHGIPDTMNRFEHWWNTPVHVILFFFGLINGGVAFSSVGSGTWIVLISLLAGKPLGILLMTFLAARFGLRAPGGLSYLHTAVLGTAAGIGFTVALFFATAAFPAGRILDEAKMGALLSFLAGPIAIAFGRAVRLSPRP